MAHTALLYINKSDKSLQCRLCTHFCNLRNGERGKCLVRENINGKMITHSYGNIIAQHADSIEKKPLFHFLPGSRTWSIATPGCNFTCKWCQNWEISQLPRQNISLTSQPLKPEDIVEDAIKNGCRSIAYTYTEPTIFFEYAFDVAKIAKSNGLKNIFVSNGYMSKEMLELFHPLLDAVNIDIKAFSDETYKKYTGAHLKPVLDSCKRLNEYGIWIEITTLVIPGINTDLEEMTGLADFIAKELGEETPWHISRYFPAYKFNKIGATPSRVIGQIEELGKKGGLKFVYSGNMTQESATKCPQCQQDLIIRWGNTMTKNIITEDSTCPSCATKIPGLFTS